MRGWGVPLFLLYWGELGVNSNRRRSEPVLRRRDGRRGCAYQEVWLHVML